jgi:hypothetical protein
LTENYQSGTPLQLAIQCRPGDGFGLFLMGALRVSTVATVALALDRLRAQTAFTHWLI